MSIFEEYGAFKGWYLSYSIKKNEQANSENLGPDLGPTLKILQKWLGKQGTYYLFTLMVTER